MSTPYSHEAQLCISVNIYFSHFNNLMQKNIIFIACMIYIEDIVIRRPMTFHNYNTCTSLLQYTRTHTYTNIKTSVLYVNEWAVQEGGGNFFL